jgi:hypothetical protein
MAYPDDPPQPVSRLSSYWFCGQCGGLVPETAPALTAPDPEAAVACGQCGGPAAPGGLTVPQYDRYGRYAEPVDWPLCHLCAVVGRGPYQDAAMLADVLASRVPGALPLPLLAFRLSWEPVTDPSSFPETGWASFARRIAALGPYCQVRAEARVGDRPGVRWGHVPPASLLAIVTDLEKIGETRKPIRHSSGRPCCVCGNQEGPPRQWTVDQLRREPVCGTCASVGGRPAPLPPPGIAQAEAVIETAPAAA